MGKAKSHKPRWQRQIAITAGVFVVTVWCTPAQCAKPEAGPLNEQHSFTVELPLLAGWYDGGVVYYLTTDVSQQEMARAAGANFAPRLRHALRPPEPGQPTALDRVYKFVNFDQGSVFPSAPQPEGSADYTPFWVVYQVTWLPGAAPHLLRSEQEIDDAEQRKLVSVAPTDVVVNCPILFSAKSGPRGNMKIHLAEH